MKERNNWVEVICRLVFVCDRAEVAAEPKVLV